MTHQADREKRIDDVIDDLQDRIDSLTSKLKGAEEALEEIVLWKDETCLFAKEALAKIREGK